MPISPDSVLITGGRNSMGLTYEINLKNIGIQHDPILEIKRANHAMAWIDGFPAVIGGENDEGIKINSVELLKGNK